MVAYIGREFKDESGRFLTTSRFANPFEAKNCACVEDFWYVDFWDFIFWDIVIFWDILQDSFRGNPSTAWFQSHDGRLAD